MTRSTTQGVIFDLDGVLIDSEGLQYRAYSQVLAEWGVAVSVDEYATHWIAAGNGPEYAVRTYQLPVSASELRARKHPVYHTLLQQHITLMPGVLPALTRLSDVYPIALATNSSRKDVSFVMDHFDLRRFFTAIVTRDDYAHPKPAPDAFVTAAAQLGLPPSACVVIEDAHKGLLAAHQAGTPVIAMPNAYTRNNDFSLAARQLPNMDALSPAVIDAILRSA